MEKSCDSEVTKGRNSISDVEAESVQKLQPKQRYQATSLPNPSDASPTVWC